VSFSFTLARVFGIPLRVHGLFVALVAALLLTGAGTGRGLATLVLLGVLFASVLLHELGHSLVARRFGAHIVDITLWPLGGLSRMTGVPERPREETLVALAGPATNLLALLIALPFGVEISLVSLRDGGWLDAFACVNAALALFNLAPAFPMDGGRALRALLSARHGYLQATEIAVRIGRLFTAIAIVASLFVEGLFLPVAVIGAFLLVQGWIELQSVRARHGGAPWISLLQRAMGTTAPPEPPPPPTEDGARLRRDLEQYRGTLEEFFRERNDR
jgi:Zn-dependent protease